MDRTAFYATSGGQPHDTGHLVWATGATAVLDVRSDGDRVLHTLAGPIPEVGTTVTGEVDDGRRRHMMRTHTAMHILCGVIWRDWMRVVTGGNLIPDYVTEIRVVDIVGLDKQADGGTHVSSTGQVGRLEVTKTESKGKGFKRVRFVLHDE